MKHKVFVDGQEGTTGLKINERLENHKHIDVLKIDLDKKKDLKERARLLNEADIAFLCLPDAAAREAVSMISNNRTRIIDASTAHRTEQGWAYGMPELSTDHRKLIESSNRVSVPGCYATGFNLLMYPLLKSGFVPTDYPVTCHAVSGYSGGGKKLIEQFESKADKNPTFESPVFYALGLAHKHLPEMHKICGLKAAPLFTPIVADFYQGMLVAIPILPRLLSKDVKGKDIQEFLAEYYKDQRFVKVMPYNADSNLDNGFLNATKCNHTNRAELFIFGNNEQILLMTRLDNLGKGASGAAVQNMNIMLSIDEGTGLE